MKRSGRTIIAVSLGLLMYSGFVAWYDGPRLSKALIQGLSLRDMPPSLQAGLNRLQQLPYGGDLFLVQAETVSETPVLSWSRATHSDPLVGLQLHRTLKTAYPDQRFHVIRYRNLQTLAEDLTSAKFQRSEHFRATLLQGDQFWFDVKFLVALVLAALLLLTLRQLGTATRAKA